MAKFRKFLMGGVVGAGLALVLSRREVRKVLMGAGRKALPAAPESSGSAGFSTYKPATAAVPAEVESEITPADEALAQEAAWLENPPVEAPVQEPAQPARAAQLIQEAPYSESAPEALVEEAPAVEDTTDTPETPAAEEPAAPMQEEPVDSKPAAVEPVGENPIDLLGPARESGAGEWDALKFPAAGEPTLENETPATAESFTEASGTPGPAGIDRDEMRRRIDETRSRLKAKAFDAMVSGETFLDETEAEKEQPRPKTASGLDADVEKSIDESLKESD